MCLTQIKMTKRNSLVKCRMIKHGHTDLLPYLMMRATLSAVDLDTFSPSIRTMKSSGLSPAASAADPASTRYTFTGLFPDTVNP